MDQDLALSLILFILYIAPVLYILKKCFKILKIPVSILSFVDNGLLVAQSKSLAISNSNLFYSYNIIFSILKRFGLIMEYRKTKVFHFSRSHSLFNLPLLNLSTLGGPILQSKCI